MIKTTPQSNHFPIVRAPPFFSRLLCKFAKPFRTMEQIFDNMRKTGRLRLDKTQTLMHYFFVLVLVGIPLLIALLLRNSIGDAYKTAFYVITAICLTLAAAYSLRQYRSLRFKVFHAALTEQEFRDMFEHLAKEMHWIAEYSGEGYIVATIEFRWTNWGTLITLIRDRDRILVNSICDLHRKPSTISWGQNRRNVEAVYTYLRERGFSS